MSPGSQQPQDLAGKAFSKTVGSWVRNMPWKLYSEKARSYLANALEMNEILQCSLSWPLASLPPKGENRQWSKMG